MENNEIPQKTENTNFEKDVDANKDSDWIPGAESSELELVAATADANESVSSHTETNGTPVQKRKRKELSCPMNWKGNKNRRLREEGKGYLGWSRKKSIGAK